MTTETNTEEPELTPPYYLTSGLEYQARYIETAEDEQAEAAEALRVAARDLRHAELRNTIAVANLEKTKMDLQTTRDNIAKWIADERKRLVRKKEAEAKAAETPTETPTEDAAPAEETEDQSPVAVMGIDLDEGIPF